MSLLTSGWFSRPVGRRIRLRRSTVVLTTAFVVLGSLYLQVRPEADDESPDEVVVVVPAPSTP